MLKSKKKEKIIQLETINNIFTNLKTLLVVGYSGLKVKDFQKFKKNIASENSKLQFFKNSLLNKVAQEKKWVDANSVFKEKIFLIFNQEESIATIKKTYQFSNQFSKTKIKLGLLGKNWLKREMIKEIALLPNKQELLLKLVNILRLIPQSLVLVLKKILEKKEKI